MSNATVPNEKTKSIKVRASSVALLAILALALGAGGLYAYAASSASFNNVQISIQTSSSLPYSYVVSAYNSSGSLVSYVQTDFPAAAFELPSATYLFTVTAYHYSPYPCAPCLPPIAASQTQSGPAIKTILPEPIRAPDVEYGYSVQQVSGPESISINTQNVSSIPTTSVTVKVTYFNGTAAAGASVSAFVVGQSYYYWGNAGTINMSGQTNGQGIATLVVPQVPVEVDAWLSVPIVLPQNQTTVQTNIGGQKINVTVYWQPMEVSLSGSALIIPPANGATVVLQYQQPTNIYYPTPYATPGAAGSSSGSSGVTTASQGSGAATPPASQAASSTAQSSPATRISPFDLSPGQTPTTQSTQHSTASAAQASGSGPISPSILWVGVAAVVVAVALAALFIARSHPKQ
jgi:hypothetical protein